MFLEVGHDMCFTYDDFISESWVELRIEPVSAALQTVNSFYLAVGPRTRVFRYVDCYGNAVRHFSIAEYHRSIEVKSRSVVETRRPEVSLGDVDEPVGERTSFGGLLDFLYFSGPITDSPALRKMYRSIGLGKGMPVGEVVATVGRHVHHHVRYMPNLTTYESTIDEALSHGAGVCQDLAQIMIGLLRLAGVPARYVSGYAFSPRLDRESAESHAWVEFYSRRFGWVGYDPTANRQPDGRYVLVATARHYDEAPPNRGIYRGAAKETLKTEVRVKQIDAPPFALSREEIRDIDLPVFAEVPNRRTLGPPDEQSEQASQQQQ